MPQTLGSQLKQSLLIKKRMEPTEYEEMSALNSVIKRNQETDPNIIQNRELTNENKLFELTKRRIDNNALPFAEALMNGEQVKSDLDIKDITSLKNQLPKVMENLNRYGNPNKSPEVSNYINHIGVKYSNALKSAEDNAKLEDSLGYITSLVNDLGDEGRMDGTYSYANTEFLIENIRKAQGQNLSVAGKEITDHYKPLITTLQDKQYVFDALKHYTSNGKSEVNSSPKALAMLNESIRIMRTSGDEDIGGAKTLLEKIPEMIGARADKELNESQTTDDNEEKDELKTVESVGQALTSAADSYFKDDLNKNIQKKMGFTITNFKAGTYKTKEGRSVVSKDTRTKMKSLLKGVKDFNEKTSFENKDYASDLNIYKMLRQKNPNMNQIVRYFTDERPVQTPDGKKSLGYMRIQEMDTGNDNENMFFRDMMSHLTDLEHHIRRQDPMQNPDEVQEFSKKKEDAKKRLQSILEMRKTQNAR